MALEKEKNATLNKLKEAVIDTAHGGVGGVFLGYIGGMVVGPPNLRNPRALAPLSRTQYARLLSRDCSVFTAVVLGTKSIMSGIRGKDDDDDPTSRLVAASCGGLALSFVSKGFKVKPAHALSYAAVYTVLYKVIDTIF